MFMTVVLADEQEGEEQKENIEVKGTSNAYDGDFSRRVREGEGEC